jgi:hypothetical protein
MNNYGPWWNETITIYNKYTDPVSKLITWHRHVVSGAFWKNIGNKIEINNVTIDTDAIICRIRIDEQFLPKHKWIALPNDEMDEYFTLGRGDIIVRDEVEDEIAEYTSGYKSTDLVKKYKDLQGCLTIDEVTINTDGGRGNEHYLVRGK